MLDKIKKTLGLIGIIIILFQLYFFCYEKPHEEQLINDTKLLTLFMLTEDFADYNDADNKDYLYGEKA